MQQARHVRRQLGYAAQVRQVGRELGYAGRQSGLDLKLQVRQVR